MDALTRIAGIILQADNVSYKPFGMGNRSDCALRVWKGIANQRAYDAIAFPTHPKHDSDRWEIGLQSWLVVLHAGKTIPFANPFEEMHHVNG